MSCAIRPLLLLLLACAPVPERSRIFKVTEAVFPNPERGPFTSRDVRRSRDFATLFSKGGRRVRGLVYFDDGRTKTCGTRRRV